jgi:mevalonate kinase
MIVNASAPGSVMLFGEHAVLRNKLAISASVNKRMHVTLTPREDDEIHIHSALGEYHCTLNNINIEAPFQFVLASIKQFGSSLPSGFDLTIESEFSHTVGLGSSSAITVATLAAIHHWAGIRFDRHALFILARTVIQSVQGLGSGADVAASVFGGVIAYQMDPASITQLKHLPELSLIYTGSKKPTVEVVTLVNAQETENPAEYLQYFHDIEQCSLQAKDQIETGSWNELAKTMNTQQIIMKEMKLSTQAIDKLIDQALSENNILGAKLSGSGLGDCIVTLGKLTDNCFPKDEVQRNAGVRQINIELENKGVLVESN